jgi:Subtilase family
VRIYIVLVFICIYQLGIAQIVTKQSNTNNYYYVLDLKNRANEKIASQLNIVKVLESQRAIVSLNQPVSDTSFNLLPILNSNWKWYATTPIENVDYPLSIYIHTKNKHVVIKYIDNKKELIAVLDDTETIGVETVKRKAQIEFNLLGQDFTLNGITQLRKHYPQLQGKGIKLSIKEALMDITDVDIQNRYQPSKLASKILNPHASAMATIIGGAGNSYRSGYGVAKQLTYSSASYDSLQPNAIAILNEEATYIQNHSYGVGVENYYGADAQAYDQQVYNHPTTLHVFSAGNSGDKTTTVGAYANVSKFSNLTGNFKP